MKKAFIWLVMLWKRLLLKKGFLVLLVIIPLAALLISLSASGDHGFMTVALTAGAEGDELSQSVIDELCNDEKAFRFLRCDTEEEAVKLVEGLEADSAWIINPDLAESITEDAPKGKLELATVYQREDNVLLRMAREKLYSAVYSDISYSIYASYVTDVLLPETEISETELKENYLKYAGQEPIMNIRYADGTAYTEDSDYITSPLRGLFAVMMLLCGLAAAAYFISEEKRGVYALIAPGKRIIVMATSNFCALATAGVFVTLALIMSGLYTGFWRESVNMLLFVLTSTVFCTFVGTLIGSVAGICVAIPVILVAATVFCPVFISLNMAKPLQMLLPPYHYLGAVYNSSVMWSAVIYLAVGCIACGICSFLRKRNSR